MAPQGTFLQKMSMRDETFATEGIRMDQNFLQFKNALSWLSFAVTKQVLKPYSMRQNLENSQDHRNTQMNLVVANAHIF